MFSWKTFNEVKPQLMTLRYAGTWHGWICKYNIYSNQYTIDSKTQNHTVTLKPTLHLRSSNRSYIYIYIYALKIIWHFSACVLKSKLPSVPPLKVRAMLLATSLCWLCIWRKFTCLLSQTQDISWMYSLKCYSILWHMLFRIISKSGTRSDRALPSVRYKARRVGELRMSTDSALPPPPLWLSSPSVRESSSGHANVNTDR